jgi:hypothetical protein
MPTIVDVLLEADPDSVGVMGDRLKALANKEDPSKEDPKVSDAACFVRLKRIPQLHFMSMQIFEDGHFDPLLVFENNFDGGATAYWQSALKELSVDLRPIFACTKEAKLSKWAPLFEPGEESSLVEFIEAHSVSPSAQHCRWAAQECNAADGGRTVGTPPLGAHAAGAGDKPRNPEWKPTGETAADIQGLTLSAYPAQRFAMLVMVQFPASAAARPNAFPRSRSASSQ